MIKLIYATIIADPDALHLALKELDIPLIGISTVENHDAPETLVYLNDKTSEEQKGQVDNTVRGALKKDAPAKPNPEIPPAKEELVVDEPRAL